MADQEAGKEKTGELLLAVEKISGLLGVDFGKRLNAGKTVVAEKAMERVGLTYLRQGKFWKVENFEGDFPDRQPSILTGRNVDLWLDINAVGEGVVNGGVTARANEYLSKFVFNSLALRGLAYIYPLEWERLGRLRPALFAVWAAGGRFKVGRERGGKYVLAVGRQVEPVIGPKIEEVRLAPELFEVARLEKYQDKEGVESFLAQKDLPERPVHDRFIAIYDCRHRDLEPLKIGDGLTLGYGDRFLLWGHLNFSAGRKGLAESLDFTEQYLKAFSRIKAVITMTWMAEAMKRLGFKEAQLPVTMKCLRCELSAINWQIMELWSRGGSIAMGHDFGEVSFLEVARNLSYWYCLRGDFKNPLKG